MLHQSRSAAVLLVVLALVVGCSSGRSTAPDYAGDLQHKVTAGAMLRHLARLQQIADVNGGNRAVGTPGFDASVAYVVNTLRANGFDVQTPQFEFRQFHADPPTLTVGGAAVAARALEYSAGTPAQGVGGPLVAAPDAGCRPEAYDGLPIAGAVALVDRGGCPFSAKEAAAVQRGAVALVVADNVDEDRLDATLGENIDVKIPVVGVGRADGARLRAGPGPATLRLNASVTALAARNVIAQTKTGSPRNVVVVGAHLDSVPAGPGINDNGSGVAAVLETAVQMGSSPPVRNAVRFAFWGAEELGLVGSDDYVRSLDLDGLKDIALCLNFDMLGSPNPGYFTYGGDQSAGIERTLAGYLSGAGKSAQHLSFDGRSDYVAFDQAGIPAGGLFSGAEDNKNADQARLWGGHADQPFDPDYHRSTDTLDHVDRTALAINGEGVAYAVGFYARDLGGGNGVPIREDRTRHLNVT